MDCKEVDREIPQSLNALARLGLRKARADGFAIDCLTPSGQAWERKSAEGIDVPRTFVEELDELTVVSYSLGAEGEETVALSFVFEGQTIPAEAKMTLDQIACASRSVWQVWHAHTVYARNVLRVAELEAALVDAKVTDRVCAFLEMDKLEMDKLRIDPIKTITRAVTRIAGPPRLGPVLARLVVELERKTAEYALIRQAKGVLQERRSLTEAQAYFHLRQVSRQTRRPLPDVASELIELGFVGSDSRERTANRPAAFLWRDS